MTAHTQTADQPGLAHQFHTCTNESCFVCTAGLRDCAVCNGAEVDLTTDCCGRPLTPEERTLIGEAGVLDYRAGQWIRLDADIQRDASFAEPIVNSRGESILSGVIDGQALRIPAKDATGGRIQLWDVEFEQYIGDVPDTWTVDAINLVIRFYRSGHSQGEVIGSLRKQFEIRSALGLS